MLYTGDMVFSFSFFAMYFSLVSLTRSELSTLSTALLLLQDPQNPRYTGGFCGVHSVYRNRRARAGRFKIKIAKNLATNSTGALFTWFSRRKSRR